jgi:leukotriene-A4 hydrolase
MVASAAFEFEDTEAYVLAGEALLGPYAWKQVHLLVMPPSFPYGGMEGNLINITPTLLAGAKSLADVIAHEVAHSWTGNLVTSATWEHFWLNEGWTMMVQRKMVQAVIRQQQGDAAAEAFWDFDSYLGQENLRQDVCRYGEHHPFTCLVPHLEGVDPDDSFSRVPYEKGFYLLQYLQNKVGGPSKWEPFMGHYIGRFANTSLTTKDFQACLLEFFAEEGALAEGATLDDMDWQVWLHEPGMPKFDNGYDTTQIDECAAVTDAWIAAAPLAPTQPVDIADWSSSRRVAVLDHLLRRISELAEAQPPAKLPLATLSAMNAAYGFGVSKNCEIKFRWLRSTVASGCAVWEECAAFLRVYGRMKYVRPLFRDLLQDAEHRDAAVALAAEKASEYHPICTKMLKEDVKTLTAQAAIDKANFVVLGAAAAAQEAAAQEAAAQEAAAQEAAAQEAAAQEAAAQEAAAQEAAAQEAAAQEAAAQEAAAQDSIAATAASGVGTATPVADTADVDLESALQDALEAHEEVEVSPNTSGQHQQDSSQASVSAVPGDADTESKEVVNEDGAPVGTPIAESGSVRSSTGIDEVGAAEEELPSHVEGGSITDDVEDGEDVDIDDLGDDEEVLEVEEEEEEEEVLEVATRTAASTLKAESDALARSAEAAAAAAARSAKTAALLQHADEANREEQRGVPAAGGSGLVQRVTGSVQQQVDKVLEVEVTESAGSWLSTGLAVAGVAIVGAAVVYGARRWSNRGASSSS